jgi:hypothetical protein
MMKQAFFFLCAGALLAGCESRGPIELRDTDLQAENLQVLPLPAATAPEFTLADVDTEGVFTPASGNAFGQLTIVGVTSDDGQGGPEAEASLAHAVFYDRNAPVVVDGRTVGYAGLDFGTVTVDDLLVTKMEKRYPFGGVDTPAGVHYALVNRGHAGGRGFQFTGNHRYDWRIDGGPSPGFVASITSPTEIKVIGSAGGTSLSLSRTLKIRWSNHAELVRILISDLRSDGTARPLLHLESKCSRNGVAIPSSLLQVLRGVSRVRLSIMAQNARSETLPGYSDEIALKAVSIYNVVMRINR